MYRFPQVQLSNASTSFKNKRVREFIRRNSTFKHEIVKFNSFSLQIVPLSMSHYRGVKQERVVEAGIRFWRKHEGVSVTNGVEIGRCGSELGKGKWVAMETQFDDIRVYLRELREDVAGLKKS
ncbi:hypothetical protein Ddye_007391 [Dipteronia dyeriana]|uniref:Uncharacterized protein n=1 Tax=Dipteronia dyeriana TaxID=168575 RepID=A0AAD9XKB4_9ROSI|nr:hypothetical protein Ddye_007391 [Dipteronia dyeriana]